MAAFDFKAFNSASPSDSDVTSYGNVADLRSYADAFGRTVPEDEAACERLLMQAMLPIEALADQFKGEQTYEDQVLQWPRAGVLLFKSETEFNDEDLPPQLTKAQYELACVIAEGTSLYPVSTGQAIKREKLDVIETEFFAAGEGGGGYSDGTPSLPSFDAIIAPLLESSGIGIVVERA